MPDADRDPSRLFAKPAVQVERAADGAILLRSPEPLGSYPRAIGDDLARWAEEAADRPFLQERGPGGRWHGPTFAEARDRVVRLATGLLELGLSAERPVVILSDNSVDHALLTLAALEVGIPAAPISAAYSLQSRDFAKLRRMIGIAEPGLVYVADHERFGPALAAIRDCHRGVVVSSTAPDGADDPLPIGAVARHRDDSLVEAHASRVGPDTVAKLLFTSGSTGQPKAVINTQRMLCASQQAKAQVWPFLAEQPPVLVDWLPWSHTFGANHNFGLVLRHGGTLYIDGGRPLPALFGQTLANLREIAPTIYFNVPRGFDMLVAALETDASLRERFFSRLQLIFYAGAALPQHLWDALDELARRTLGSSVPMTSAWGSTETAPLATDCHFQATQAGVIGLPVPGTELKLVANGPKLEVRVRGPNVTPGYHGRPDLTAAAFDADGFYTIGDAVRFVDPEHPERGLLFDGRVSEDFKLDTGTWVNVGVIRVKAIAALAPIAVDLVITGHDRGSIGLLIFPNVAACRDLCPELPADTPLEQMLHAAPVRDRVEAGLAALKAAGTGSSSYPTRAILLASPPSIDAGEITDKGYLNQRAILDNRPGEVAMLYANESPPEVIRLE